MIGAFKIKMTFIFPSLFRSVDAVHKLTLAKINHLQPDFPHIMALLTLLATLPASSAEVERGFSQLKLLKSSLRTSLTGDHLNELMVIKMLAPDVASYNPQEAIRKWIAGGQMVRRFHRSVSKRPIVVVEDEVVEDVEEQGQAVNKHQEAVPVEDVEEQGQALDEDQEAMLGDADHAVEGAAIEAEAQEIEGAVVEQMEGELYNSDSGFEYSDDDSDLEEERIDALLKTYELE